MNVVEKLRATIRAAVGLPQDPGAPPDIMRLGLYRCTVQSCASDGSTLDVQPEDNRISGEKNVPVRVGIPGAVAIVQPGAIVLLGWASGDPSKPYCVPSWESGATVTKLVFNAQAIELAGNAYAAVLDTLISDLKTWVNAVNTVIGSNCVNGSPLANYVANSSFLAAFYTSISAVGAYKSTKVKNG